MRRSAFLAISNNQTIKTIKRRAFGERAMFVIGTAGHVDHGKSTLVRALTGIDPDRLQEEKDRGMTIDLGFAWLDLGDAEAGNSLGEVGIVDVPGHERFIKNMLAGAGGIDVALLVVASDEGVMPQTREHLAILDLLAVGRGVVALTKADLVDKDWLDFVAAEVEEVLEGTSLAGSPVVPCSGVTGAGLSELTAALRRALAETPAKRDLGRPRLPIDRAFTVAGFGAVVTGTLIDGAFEVGDEVEVLPAFVGGHLTALKSRVRGLQSHRQEVRRALPGTRTAVNLAGINVDDLSRGQVVARPGWLQPSFAVDVRLRAIASLSRPLRHNLTVSFHSGAAESPAKLRLLDADEVPPGAEGWAQVRLRRPMALVSGDRFVIRDANDTIGGGLIVATQAKRHPRRRPSVLEELERLARGSPGDALVAALVRRQPAEPEALVAASELGAQTARAALEALIAEGRIVLLAAEGASFVCTSDYLDAARQKALAEAVGYQRQHPLRRGLPREELRSRLDLPQRVFAAVVAHLISSGDVEDHGAALSTPGWKPALTPAQKTQADSLLEALRSDAFSPPAATDISEDLVAYLVAEGQVVDVGGGVIFDGVAYARMVEGIVAKLKQDGTITLAGVRDLFGTSRRYAQALLEHLDQRRITVRRGDERVLGRAAESVTR
jgi:selenocysteine-specific elongation factor